MKKTLLAIAIGSLASASTASAKWYAEGNFGYSKLKFSDEISISKSSFTPSVAVGYDWGDWRVALDYSHYGKLKYGYQEASASGNGNIKVSGVGISSLYDFNLQSALTPYVGAKLSINYVQLNETGVESDGTKFTESEKSTRFGYGVLAGAQYDLGNNFAINGAIEWNRLAKIEETKVSQYGVKVGLRYTF